MQASNCLLECKYIFKKKAIKAKAYFHLHGSVFLFLKREYLQSMSHPSIVHSKDKLGSLIKSSLMAMKRSMTHQMSPDAM